MFNVILVQPLFNLLAVIYALLPGHDFGVAIIILTIIVRLLLWPLVNKQLHSQRALQRLQPEINRLKSEAKGDKTKEGQLIMELYKEKGINPFASILPLLVQLPIFFALYIVLKDIVKAGEIAKLAYPAVQHMPAIAAAIEQKIVHPTLFGVIDLSKPSPLLAALAGLAQFFQTRQLTPKHTQGDTQAQMLTSMNYVFPFLTFFIGLSLPSALALYWVTTSSVAILQQTLVLRQDVEELEEGVKPAKKAIGAKAKGGKA